MCATMGGGTFANFTELRDLSTRKTAGVLNGRGIPAPEGGLIRVRKRLAEK
jgi:hypothetical protein